MGPRPRKNKTARYCINCSQSTGVLVERICPALDKKRSKNADKAAERAAAAAEKERAKYLFDDGGAEPFDIFAEFQRLQRYKPFRRLAWQKWALKVRRYKSPKRTHGYCTPGARKIIINLWDGLDRTDVTETIIHEMVHAVVKGQKDGPRWHGDKFRSTLEEVSRKAFNIPREVTLPTYVGSTWGLDVAITKFLREADGEYATRRAVIAQRLEAKKAKANTPKDSEKWVIDPVDEKRVTVRITPGASDAFQYGFLDWVRGDEDPQSEPRAPLAKALHNAARLPGRQGYLAEMSVAALKLLKSEAENLMSLSSIEDNAAELRGLTRLVHAYRLWEDGKRWSPRGAKFSSRYGTEWLGGVTAMLDQ